VAARNEGEPRAPQVEHRAVDADREADHERRGPVGAVLAPGGCGAVGGALAAVMVGSALLAPRVADR
jgi:hypothetical protein